MKPCIKNILKKKNTLSTNTKFRYLDYNVMIQTLTQCGLRFRVGDSILALEVLDSTTRLVLGVSRSILITRSQVLRSAKSDHDLEALGHDLDLISDLLFSAFLLKISIIFAQQ